MPRYVVAKGDIYYGQLGQDEMGRWKDPSEAGPTVVARFVLAHRKFRKRIIKSDADHLQSRRVNMILSISHSDANSTGDQYLQRLERATHPDGQPYVHNKSRDVQSIIAPEAMVRQVSTVEKGGASQADWSIGDPWNEEQLPIPVQITIGLLEADLLHPTEEIAELLAKIGPNALVELLKIKPERLDVLASGGFFGSKLDERYRNLSRLLELIWQLK